MSRVTRTKGRYTWEHTWNTHGTHIQGEAHIGTHSEHTYTLEDVAGDTNYQGEGERRVPFPNWGNLKHSLFRTEPYWKQKKNLEKKKHFSEQNRTGNKA